MAETPEFTMPAPVVREKATSMAALDGLPAEMRQNIVLFAISQEECPTHGHRLDIRAALCIGQVSEKLLHDVDHLVRRYNLISCKMHSYKDATCHNDNCVCKTQDTSMVHNFKDALKIAMTVVFEYGFPIEHVQRILSTVLDAVNMAQTAERSDLAAQKGKMRLEGLKTLYSAKKGRSQSANQVKCKIVDTAWALKYSRQARDTKPGRWVEENVGTSGTSRGAESGSGKAVESEESNQHSATTEDSAPSQKTRRLEGGNET